jgi:hypothetical protein
MKIDALEQLISEDVNVQGQIVRDGFRTCLMVFRIIAGVVVGVVTRGDAVYHHSSVVVVAGGVRTHLNACGPLLPLSRRKKPCLSKVGITGVRQLCPCARVRLPPLARRRTDLIHGAQRKTHEGGMRGRLFVAAEPHSLGWCSGQHRGRTST